MTTKSNTGKVAHNSLWYGLELGIGAVAMLGTSVLLSHVYHPEQLGDYIHLVWLTYVAGMLSSVGLPSAAQKFMAEYLAKNEPGVAYRVFRTCLNIQIAIVAVVTAVGLALAWWLLRPELFWVGFWLVLGIAPRMLSFVPSQVNAVLEDMSKNVPAVMASLVVTTSIVLASIWFQWGLIGLAISQPAGHTIELFLKLHITAKHRRAWRQTAPPQLDPALAIRLRRFAMHGIGLLLLNVIVMDRSDVVLLKLLNPDAAQVTFFSYSFTLVEKLLLVSQVLGTAMGLNVLTQFSQDRARGVAMSINSASYLLLAGMPILLGAAALAPSLWAVYGQRFAVGIPVFTTMALLAVPRIVLAPANSLLLAGERQGFLVLWGLCCGAVNVALDCLLIPRYGALGAAIGNGVGQALSACGAWTYLLRHFSASLNAGLLLRVAISALTMGAAAGAVNRSLPPLPGAVAGLAVGLVVYPAMLRLTRALGESDRERLGSLAKIFPAVLRSPFHHILMRLIPKAV